MTVRGAAVGLVAVVIFVIIWAVGITKFGVDMGAPTDKAREFHTKNNPEWFGAIDKWAFFGMTSKRLVERLSAQGYACTLPPAPVDGGRPTGTGNIHCEQTLGLPVRRTLAIDATIDLALNDRLVSATAKSTIARDASSFQVWLVDVSRQMGFIEPVSMPINGFQIDSVDLLARVIVDTLRITGWRAKCVTDVVADGCVDMARERRSGGFPSIGQGAVAVGFASELHTAMEHVRFTPVQGHAPADEGPIVRVTGGTMWLDCVGGDLTGRRPTVAIALDTEGGVPTKMVATLGSETITVALAGRPRATNDGRSIFLVPLITLVPQFPQTSQGPPFTTVLKRSSTSDTMASSSAWLNLPSNNHPFIMKELQRILPRANPAFAPRIFKAIIANISSTVPPEQELGLYPALRIIDERAEVLRALRIDVWLEQKLCDDLFANLDKSDPIAHAAWTFAICESAGSPPAIDAACWRALMPTDSAAANLLRKQVAELSQVYASLDESHPVRLRLKRLIRVLADQ